MYDWSGYSVQVDQEMAFATFDIRMEYEVRGEARERDAHGTAILVRTGDGWKLAHLHTS
nr:nuclear transport factor 2 family protein [Maricaulis maris]